MRCDVALVGAGAGDRHGRLRLIRVVAEEALGREVVEDESDAEGALGARAGERRAQKAGAAREAVLVDQGKVARLPLVLLFVARGHDGLGVELALGPARGERVGAELTRSAGSSD